MKPRTTPLTHPSPLPARYWTCEVEGRGEHVFRHPYYMTGQLIVEALPRHRYAVEPDLRSDGAKAVGMLVIAGMVIGACWQHPHHDLVTQLGDDIDAYGRAVAEELQDAGYDILEIIGLMAVCLPEVTRRQSLRGMAQARASFSDPKEDASTA